MTLKMAPEGMMDHIKSPEMQMVALLQTRSMLKLEIRSGMRHSKGSVLAATQRAGVTVAKTKRAALEDVNKLIREMGGPEDSRPLA